MEGVEEFIEPHGEGKHKRLKVSESSECEKSSITSDGSDGSPPLHSYEKFRGPDGQFHFQTFEEATQFWNDHVKCLDSEDYNDLMMSMLGLPKCDPNRPRLILRCGELALAYYKHKHNDDYEYDSDMDISCVGDSIHLNFFARRKVSDSKTDSGPTVLFFADMESEDKVKDCCIIDPATVEAAEAQCCEMETIHPPNMHCTQCFQGFYI